MQVLKINILSLLSSFSPSNSSDSISNSKKKFFNLSNKNKKKPPQKPSSKENISEDYSTDDSFPYLPVYLM